MPRPNNRLYDLLEVAPDVSPKGLEITWKRVRERLAAAAARGDAGAVARLADAESAYATLSDPAKRKSYDRYGEAGPPPPETVDPTARPDLPAEPEEPLPEPDAGPEFQGDEFGNAQARAVQGVLEVKIPLVLACKGGKADVSIRGSHRQVPVPLGTADGDVGEVHGVNVRYKVAPDRYLRRDGRDLVVDVSIEEQHARRGVEVHVPTLDGPVKVKVPKGVETGQKLRLAGKGVPFPDAPGDLYVVITVLPPDTGRVSGVGVRSGG